MESCRKLLRTGSLAALPPAGLPAPPARHPPPRAPTGCGPTLVPRPAPRGHARPRGSPDAPGSPAPRKADPRAMGAFAGAESSGALGSPGRDAAAMPPRPPLLGASSGRAARGGRETAMRAGGGAGTRRGRGRGGASGPGRRRVGRRGMGGAGARRRRGGSKKEAGSGAGPRDLGARETVTRAEGGAGTRCGRGLRPGAP